MRCVDSCVCCNFVLERLFRFVVLLRCCSSMIYYCVSVWLVSYVSEVGKSVLIIVECISVRV